MGIFSFFKREENYEEILSTLEQEIKRAEKVRQQAIERTDWWAHNWLFYMGIGWLAYLAGFVLYVWPDRHGAQAADFLFHLLAVIVVPFIVYYGRIFIRGIGKRVVERHNSKLRGLRRDLKDRLDELKKKTAFETTKTLIDRYSAGSKTPGKDSEDGLGMAMLQGKGGAAARLRQEEAKNRRRTMPNFGTPASQQSPSEAQTPETPSKFGSTPSSPLAAKTLQKQGQYPATSLGPVPQRIANAGVMQNAPLGVAQSGDGSQAGIVKVAPRSSSAQYAGAANVDGGAARSGASRPWLDKLVDQLVGDVGSEEDKYALICRHCYAHNGLVLEEEIEDIQYTCPKCGHFNPSVRALRTMPLNKNLQRMRPVVRQSDSFLERRQAHGSLVDSGDASDYLVSDNELEENEPSFYQSDIDDLGEDRAEKQREDDVRSVKKDKKEIVDDGGDETPQKNRTAGDGDEEKEGEEKDDVELSADEKPEQRQKKTHSTKTHKKAARSKDTSDFAFEAPTKESGAEQHTPRKRRSNKTKRI
ncbi:hypothetical protein GGI25_003264 [Coemansia spiralis]|uniref:Endoplasmic reticulum junction formation protein lunapark n=2 Tax=Coemansia TaxID=4863 RepID=A0A9W8KYJ4_9FUNG|nr:hypothetical protein EDC05_004327 [Coemansia umbellata]KAJ2621490.1 hypothetical protein GGI26_004069 [Coemansia sp. RSA 1358]KAJ2677168.1 hypothetical protein GGI25_003264 [Coemansia spiralis]